ncbi:hypothetical protein BH10BDE1_BH10BDE1_32980 [soil metagenome]
MYRIKRIALGQITLALFMVVAVPLFQNCSPGFDAIELAAPHVQNLPSWSNVAKYKIPDLPFDQLSQVGLGALIDQLPYENFWEYSPKYPLYSYGAEKRRWVFLPDKSQIDNSDPDGWKFPIGTVFMKLFSLNGRKIETRLWEKVGQGTGIIAWRPSVYLWRADQTDADLLKTNDFYSLTDIEKNAYEAGLVADRYKIISPNQCTKCHTSSADGPLGFNYLQLSNARSEKNVLALSQAGVLANEVVAFDSIPGSTLQQEAIGYMQTNCAVCHNGSGPGPHDFRHRSTAQISGDEGVIKSAMDTPGLITPGDPNNSRIYQRFSTATMPPGTIEKDINGQQRLWDWISSITTF